MIIFRIMKIAIIKTPLEIQKAVVLSNSEITGHNQHPELVRKNKKEIDVSSDDRFTRISINCKYYSKDNNEVYVKTLIVKDKEQKTTESHTRKIFVRNSPGKYNMIIREIFTDRHNNKSTSEHKSIYVDADSRQDIFNQIQSLLNISTEQKLQIAS